MRRVLVRVLFCAFVIAVEIALFGLIVHFATDLGQALREAWKSGNAEEWAIVLILTALEVALYATQWRFVYVCVLVLRPLRARDVAKRLVDFLENEEDDSPWRC